MSKYVLALLLLADVPVFFWDKQTGAIGVLMILLIAFIVALHQSTS